jgi:hypothetical protein
MDSIHSMTDDLLEKLENDQDFFNNLFEMSEKKGKLLEIETGKELIEIDEILNNPVIERQLFKHIQNDNVSNINKQKTDNYWGDSYFDRKRKFSVISSLKQNKKNEIDFNYKKHSSIN